MHERAARAASTSSPIKTLSFFLMNSNASVCPVYGMTFQKGILKSSFSPIELLAAKPLFTLCSEQPNARVFLVGGFPRSKPAHTLVGNHLSSSYPNALQR